ncbi:MAG: hypothetical protein GY878_02550 [Fuerstiella sp.]|nr:hypothetical protein [Fuerstiella sp.]
MTNSGHPRFFVTDLEYEFEIPVENRHNSGAAERPTSHTNGSLTIGVPLTRQSPSGA